MQLAKYLHLHWFVYIYIDIYTFNEDRGEEGGPFYAFKFWNFSLKSLPCSMREREQEKGGFLREQVCSKHGVGPTPVGNQVEISANYQRPFIMQLAKYLHLHWANP